MKPAILVVDDNPKIKKSLEMAFPEYDFVGALSGEEGLSYLKKPHEIDLVILDYRMNGLSGIDVLEKVRGMDGGMGVFLLTSFGSKELVVEALRHHADDFIDKPFSVDEMKSKLENYFEKRALRETSPAGTDPIQKIQRFVQRNFRHPLTLDDAAQKASLSPKYLSRKFKQETRQGFSDYKIKLRVDQAKNLLDQTSLGIAQIAYKVGYENAESFMKIFKRVSGCTPTEYRRRMPHTSDTGRG